MKRLIETRLEEWRTSPQRKPLLLRGARQVGKTTSARVLGRSFDSFVEINFERLPAAGAVLDRDLDAKRIVRDLGLIAGQEIVPGRTLLFLDELQEAPRGLIALRYLFEELPELHVIAAGSLLEFQIEAQGLPVGRVEFAYMFPMTLVEFLWAKGEALLADFIDKLPGRPISEPIHTKLLALLGEYMAIGGMPEAVGLWCAHADLGLCQKAHQEIIQSYRQDFEKYAKKSQVERVAHIFDELPTHVTRKWKFSNVSGDHRARELRPALELLEKSHVVQSVLHTSANALPLGAECNRRKRKLLMLDIGLMQTMLGLDAKDWILTPNAALAGRGPVVESFIGQELTCHLSGTSRQALYYWLREARSSNAEVDYVIPKGGTALPIEVKSGKGGRHASLNAFLDSHPNSPIGIVLSQANTELGTRIRKYPLYTIGAIAKTASDGEGVL